VLCCPLSSTCRVLRGGKYSDVDKLQSQGTLQGSASCIAAPRACGHRVREYSSATMGLAELLAGHAPSGEEWQITVGIVRAGGTHNELQEGAGDASSDSNSSCTSQLQYNGRGRKLPLSCHQSFTYIFWMCWDP
jgi:hypothetical protein